MSRKAVLESGKPRGYSAKKPLKQSRTHFAHSHEHGGIGDKEYGGSGSIYGWQRACGAIRDERHAGTWTVVPVAGRKIWMQALKKAVGEDIWPFTDLLAGLVKSGLAGAPLPAMPKRESVRTGIRQPEAQRWRFQRQYAPVCAAVCSGLSMGRSLALQCSRSSVSPRITR